MFHILNSLYIGFKASTLLLLIIFAVSLYNAIHKERKPPIQVNHTRIDQTALNLRKTQTTEYENSRLKNAKAYLLTQQQRLTKINTQLTKNNLLPQVIRNLEGERKLVQTNINNTQKFVTKTTQNKNHD